jgi:hypothetical protein
MPNAPPSHALNPVIGSVRFGSGAAAALVVAGAAAVLVPAVVLGALGAVAGAGVPLDPDDGAGVVELVVFGGGVAWCVVVVVPASGSLYWLSPADGPLANATGGRTATATAIASAGSQILVTRRLRT